MNGERSFISYVVHAEDLWWVEEIRTKWFGCHYGHNM